MAHLIVALDATERKKAEEFVHLLGDSVDFYKVGYTLFFTWGPDAVRFLKGNGKKVFLDLKFYDIPNTMRNAAMAAVDLGVDMLNFHLIAGRDAACAMKDVIKLAPKPRPLLIGVTRLTSESVDEGPVLDMAGLAVEWDIDGVVCSAIESPRIKQRYKGLLTVCPGISVEKDRNDDQKRVVAIDRITDYKPDYIVVGRPVLNAKDPVRVVEYIKRFL